MDIEEIGKELICIKQRLTAIETDIAWFKSLAKWVLIGGCALFGIEISPYLI